MLRHLAQIAGGPREGKDFLNDILTKAFSNTPASGLQSLYEVGKLENGFMTNNCSQGLVLAFTKNDDSETLTKVLQIAQDASENPMQVKTRLTDSFRTFREIR